MASSRNYGVGVAVIAALCLASAATVRGESQILRGASEAKLDLVVTGEDPTGGLIGALRFIGVDDNPDEETYATIQGVIDDDTDEYEEGAIRVYVVKDGVTTKVLVIDGDGLTVSAGSISGDGSGLTEIDVSDGTNLSADGPLSLVGDSLSISQASSSVNGYLSSTDWSAFNAKLGPSSVLGNLSDVTVSAPAQYQLLQYDGSGFVNAWPSRLTASDGSPNDALIVDSLGRVGIATPAPVHDLSVSDSGDNAVAAFYAYANSSGTRAIFLGCRYRGTQESPLSLQSGDLVADFAAWGYNGTAGALQQAAKISVETDAAPADSSADMPGRIEMHTTPDGSSASALRLTVDSTGQVTPGSNGA